MILVHFFKAFYQSRPLPQANLEANGTSSEYKMFGVDLEPYYLKDFVWFWVLATTISFVMFLGIGVFLHVRNLGSSKKLP